MFTIIFLINTALSIEIERGAVVDEILRSNIKLQSGSLLVLDQYYKKNNFSKSDISFRCEKIKNEVFCKLVDFKGFK